MQSKLLRVLQENSFYRVGGTTPKNVNVRVICANNIPLQKLVNEGKFREDLYYRLNICCINVPPLRERPEDIECLVRHSSTITAKVRHAKPSRRRLIKSWRNITGLAMSESWKIQCIVFTSASASVIGEDAVG